MIGSNKTIKKQIKKACKPKEIWFEGIVHYCDSGKDANYLVLAKNREQALSKIRSIHEAKHAIRVINAWPKVPKTIRRAA